MGFREIAMIVVSLILVGILGLAVAPSITASGDATKTSVVASEFDSVLSASKMWMANNSTAGNFNGVTAQAMSAQIPNLTASGSGATSTLVSKVNTSITYQIASATTTSTDDSVQITISGLTAISGAEASLATSLATKGTVTNTSATDGILVVKIRG